jgi:hypothetical protein
MNMVHMGDNSCFNHVLPSLVSMQISPQKYESIFFLIFFFFIFFKEDKINKNKLYKIKNEN